MRTNLDFRGWGIRLSHALPKLEPEHPVVEPRDPHRLSAKVRFAQQRVVRPLGVADGDRILVDPHLSPGVDEAAGHLLRLRCLEAGHAPGEETRAKVRRHRNGHREVHLEL